MLFNSFEFLIFFPIICLGFYIIPHKYRWLWLLSGSYYFYMAAKPSLVLLLIISTLTDYFCAHGMHKTLNDSLRKGLLVVSITVNLGLLFTFKYLVFFTDTINDLLALFKVIPTESSVFNSYNFNKIILPIGISFYTFQTLSYSIDVYRRKIIPEKHLGKFALYVAFFPQLVAGPIERASRLLPQFKRKIQLNIPEIRKGLATMAWGFFLKIVVADRLGIYVDEVYSNQINSRGFPLIVSMYFFGYQIYYDFLAYTTIAIGAANVMGFKLIQNFNKPLFAISASEFWKRWHISLTQWFRDYLYRPLVKNAKLSRVSAVFIVFFANGLWHGANWTFVVWSILNAIFLIIEVGTNKMRAKLIQKLNIPRYLISFLGWFIVINYLMLTLIFFRAPSLTYALVYIKNMAHIGNLSLNNFENPLEILIGSLLIVIVQTIHYFKGNNKIHELVLKRPRYIRWGMYISYIFIIVLLAINRQNTFIYFQF